MVDLRSSLAIAIIALTTAGLPSVSRAQAQSESTGLCAEARDAIVALVATDSSSERAARAFRRLPDECQAYVAASVDLDSDQEVNLSEPSPWYEPMQEAAQTAVIVGAIIAAALLISHALNHAVFCRFVRGSTGGWRWLTSLRWPARPDSGSRGRPALLRLLLLPAIAITTAVAVPDSLAWVRAVALVVLLLALATVAWWNTARP